MIDRSTLLTQLKQLLPLQFREVLNRYGFPSEYVSNNTTQLEQAIDLLSYAEQHELGLKRLLDIVTEVMQPPPAAQLLDKQRLDELKTALFDCMDMLGAETFQNIGNYLKQIEKHGFSPQHTFHLETVEQFLLNKADALSTAQFIQFCQTKLFQSANQLDYQGLVRRLQFGDVALFLGLDTTASPALSQRFFNNVKTTCNYHAFHSLPEACEYMQIDSGRGFLVATLQQLLGSDNPISALYSLLAHVEKPLLIIYAGYDDLLEQAFRQQHKPYACISHASEREKHWLEIDYVDKASETCSSEDFSKKQLMENGYSLIYRIRGLYRNSEQEWLVLSEQDYLDFVRHSKMPDYIVSRLDRRSLWFLGHHPCTWEDRMLVNTVLEKRRRDADITLAIHKDADPFAQMHWKKRNHVDNYALDLQEFVAELQRHLDLV